MSKLSVLGVLAVVLITGCAENKTRVAEGAGLGGVLGAVAGGVMGYQSGHPVQGALIGGAAGGAVGGVVGAQIEKPEAETNSK